MLFRSRHNTCQYFFQGLHQFVNRLSTNMNSIAYRKAFRPYSCYTLIVLFPLVPVLPALLCHSRDLSNNRFSIAFSVVESLGEVGRRESLSIKKNYSLLIFDRAKIEQDPSTRWPLLKVCHHSGTLN